MDDTKTFNQIQDTKQKINNFYRNQVENRAKLIQQNFYENGPKSKKITWMENT